MTTVYGDRRKFDWNRCASGRPNIALIADNDTRRAFQANQQNMEYLLRKIRDIHPPQPDEQITDITQKSRGKPPPPKTDYPQAIMISGLWIEPTDGTIVGKVNPNGSATTYYFEYMHYTQSQSVADYPYPDFSSSTRKVTTTKSAGAGDVFVTKTESLTLLTVPARYYVRILATNTKGSCVSNIIRFDTGKKPDVTVKAAKNITYNSATIVGTVDANSLAATYHFNWGEDPGSMVSAGEHADGSGTDAVEYTQALGSSVALVEDTLYYYQMVGTNAVGTSNSGILTFRTLKHEAPEVTISAPSPVTDETAHLTGTVEPKYTESLQNATYEFLLGLTHGNATYGLIIVDTIANPVQKLTGSTAVYVALSWDVVSLLPGTQYYCQVRAWNSYGFAWSDIWGFTTPIAEITLTGTLAFADFVEGDTGTEVVQGIIENTGGDGSHLNWTGTLNLDAGWATDVVADAASGTLHAGETSNVNFTMTKTGISAGTYAGTWSVADPYCTTKTLPLTLTVKPLYTGNMLINSKYYVNDVLQTDSSVIVAQGTGVRSYSPRWGRSIQGGALFDVGRSTYVSDSDDWPIAGVWGGTMATTAYWDQFGNNPGVFGKFTSNVNDFSDAGCPQGTVTRIIPGGVPFHTLSEKWVVTYSESP